MRNLQHTSDSDQTFSQAVVAADHIAASEAGREILSAGGNVIDAAVATSFALSVVRPASCGIGGGGFMVIWNAKAQTALALDYRERAPAKVTREMFVNASPLRNRPVCAAVHPLEFPERWPGCAMRPNITVRCP